MGGLFGTDTRPGEVVIFDQEASLEHMARGTARSADLILAVTEPYFRSLETTARLAELARRLGIPRLIVIANKVRNPREAAAVQEFCDRHGLTLGAIIPYDEAVTAADHEGVALLDAAPSSVVVARITELGERLLQEVS